MGGALLSGDGAPYCIVILMVSVLLLLFLLTPGYDLLIHGGTVIDGAGSPGFRADVAIRDGRIAKVGDLSGAEAERVIDATGLIVAPGFIDVHTHADELAENPRAENYLRMGVTTVVAGNCGSSALEIGKALAAIREAGPSINYATLIGHNVVRAKAMGGSFDRPPTDKELEMMRGLVAEAMEAGAFGIVLECIPRSIAAKITSRPSRSALFFSWARTTALIAAMCFMSMAPRPHT